MWTASLVSPEQSVISILSFSRAQFLRQCWQDRCCLPTSDCSQSSMWLAAIPAHLQCCCCQRATAQVLCTSTIYANSKSTLERAKFAMRAVWVAEMQRTHASCIRLAQQSLICFEMSLLIVCLHAFKAHLLCCGCQCLQNKALTQAADWHTSSSHVITPAHVFSSYGTYTYSTAGNKADTVSLCVQLHATHAVWLLSFREQLVPFVGSSPMSHT